MRRALVWLNLYGCEAVRHMLKNSLKTQKTHFLPVFELMSDSTPLHALRTTSDQIFEQAFILQTQDPNYCLLRSIREI